MNNEKQWQSMVLYMMTTEFIENFYHHHMIIQIHTHALSFPKLTKIVFLKKCNSMCCSFDYLYTVYAAENHEAKLLFTISIHADGA